MPAKKPPKKGLRLVKKPAKKKSGDNGKSRAGAKNHPASVVAQVLAEMVAGATVAEVSEKYAIPQQTISGWKALLPPELGETRTKRETVEELLSVYLEKILRANIAQLDVFANADWIQRQRASDLAILQGVLFDKAIRIFDAARRGERERELQQLPPAPG